LEVVRFMNRQQLSSLRWLFRYGVVFNLYPKEAHWLPSYMFSRVEELREVYKNRCLGSTKT
jgi:hypothetical protein